MTTGCWRQTVGNRLLMIDWNDDERLLEIDRNDDDRLLEIDC